MADIPASLDEAKRQTCFLCFCVINKMRRRTRVNCEAKNSRKKSATELSFFAVATAAASAAVVVVVCRL